MENDNKTNTPLFDNASDSQVWIERMKKALDEPSIMVPPGLSRDELIDFILSHSDKKSE